jgi:hypothetical protein
MGSYFESGVSKGLSNHARLDANVYSRDARNLRMTINCSTQALAIRLLSIRE